MADLLKPTLDELIACAEREARLRRRVYPRHVLNRRMSQEKADREIECMEAIASRLHTLRDGDRDR